MNVHFLCGYYSDLAHHKKRRTEDYWDAYFFCWAVKTGLYKRPFNIHLKNGKLAIHSKNITEARKTFGKWIVNRLPEFGSSPGLIVPVPSKDAVGEVRTYRTLEMVNEALTAADHDSAAFDGLHWTEKLAPAHAGGPRSRQALAQYLKAGDVKGKNVVLVDDLLSKGGHLLAAADKLQENGATVLGAVVCGRTIYDFETKPFGAQQLELTEELADWHG